jgi:hypothetical protein
MSTWIDFRTEPVTDTLHETLVNGTQVECNFIYCNYTERFETIEDAEVAASIHEQRDTD